MLDLIASFATWLQTLPPGWIYVVLLFIAYVENLIPPIPGDVAIAVSGSLVGLGVLDLAPTLLVGALGGTLGFTSIYGIGRRLGPAVHDPDRLRWIPRRSLERVTAWLDRWGYVVVGANRFLAGGRAVIGLLAGASGLPWPAVVFWAAVSSVLWTATLVGLGWWLGSEWAAVADWLRIYGKAVLVLLAAGGAAVWARQALRARAAQRSGVRTV